MLDSHIYWQTVIISLFPVHIGSQMDAGGRLLGLFIILTPLNRERFPLPTIVLGAARSAIKNEGRRGVVAS